MCVVGREWLFTAVSCVFLTPVTLPVQNAGTEANAGQGSSAGANAKNEVRVAYEEWT